MIVYAGIMPNSPLLLPNVSGEQYAKKTVEAIRQMRQHLRFLSPDAVILLSEHRGTNQTHASIEVADPYHLHLSDVGDFTDHMPYRPALALIDALQRQARDRQIPLTLNSSGDLPVTAAVPLLLLGEKLPPIIPLSPAQNNDSKTRRSLGNLIAEVSGDRNARIAIIAAGHTSHVMNDLSPQGFRESGPKLHLHVLELLKERNLSGLLQVSEDERADALDTLIHPLTTLFGAIEEQSGGMTILSEEFPLGVSFIAAEGIFS